MVCAMIFFFFFFLATAHTVDYKYACGIMPLSGARLIAHLKNSKAGQAVKPVPLHVRCLYHANSRARPQGQIIPDSPRVSHLPCRKTSTLEITGGHYLALPNWLNRPAAKKASIRGRHSRNPWRRVPLAWGRRLDGWLNTCPVVYRFDSLRENGGLQ